MTAMHHHQKGRRKGRQGRQEEGLTGGESDSPRESFSFSCSIYPVSLVSLLLAEPLLTSHRNICHHELSRSCRCPCSEEIPFNCKES